TKPASPQGEVPPNGGAGMKKWNHQVGANVAQGGGETPEARYRGDVGDARPYRYNGGTVASGKAPRSDAQAVPGSDAEPNIGMDYGSPEPAPDRTSHRRVPAPSYKQTGGNTLPASFELGSETPPPAPTER